MNSTGFVEWFLNLGTHYPDLVALCVGALSGTAAAVLLEMFAFPLIWTKRQKKGAMVLSTILISLALSSVLWGALDGADTAKLRWITSLCVAILNPFLTVWAAKVLTHYVPWFNSVWALAITNENEHDPLP